MLPEPSDANDGDANDGAANGEVANARRPEEWPRTDRSDGDRLPAPAPTRIVLTGVRANRSPAVIGLGGRRTRFRKTCRSASESARPRWSVESAMPKTRTSDRSEWLGSPPARRRASCTVSITACVGGASRQRARLAPTNPRSNGALCAIRIVRDASPRKSRNGGSTFSSQWQSRTIASVMPCIAVTDRGIGRNGLINCVNRSISVPSSRKRTAPISTIRPFALEQPVVSVSNATKSSSASGVSSGIGVRIAIHDLPEHRFPRHETHTGGPRRPSPEIPRPGIRWVPNPQNPAPDRRPVPDSH